MKKLSEASGGIVKAAKLTTVTPSTCQDGSRDEDGKEIGQYNPPRSAIADQNQATQIAYLLRQAEPRKRYSSWYKGENGMTRDVEIVQPSLTQEQMELVRYHRRPANPNTIQKLLVKLAMHKHLKGGEDQQAYLLADYTSRLRGATELDVFNAVEWFIENDESGFFPAFARLKEKVGIE